LDRRSSVSTAEKPELFPLGRHDDQIMPVDFPTFFTTFDRLCVTLKWRIPVAQKDIID